MKSLLHMGLLLSSIACSGIANAQEPLTKDSKAATPSPKSKGQGLTKKPVTNASKEPSLMLYMLPFGVGQFYNEKPLLGGVFAATQAAGLAFSYLSWSQASSERDKTNSYIDERNTEFATLPTLEEQVAHQEETEAKVADMDATVEQRLLQANIGLGFFFVAWIAGSVEAFVGGPKKVTGPTKLKPLPSPKKKASSATVGSGSEQAAASLDALEERAEPSSSYRPQAQWSLAPVFAPPSSRQRAPVYALQWQLSF